MLSINDVGHFVCSNRLPWTVIEYKARSTTHEDCTDYKGTNTCTSVCSKGWKDPDSKLHMTNMGPTWVLSAPRRPHAAPMNFAIRGVRNLNDPTWCVIERFRHTINGLPLEEQSTCKIDRGVLWGFYWQVIVVMQNRLWIVSNRLSHDKLCLMVSTSIDTKNPLTNCFLLMTMITRQRFYWHWFER